MNTSNGVPQPDGRRQTILSNVLAGFLFDLATAQKGYKLENLTKGHDSIVDEVFRVCSNGTIYTNGREDCLGAFLGSRPDSHRGQQEGQRKGRRTGLGKLDRPEDEIAAYEEVVRRRGCGLR